MAGAAPVSHTVVLSLLLSLSLQAAHGGASKAEPAGGGGRAGRSTPSGHVPVRTVVYRAAALPAATTADGSGGGGGTSYEPFELCRGCRCCAVSNASSCVDTSCCYAIDCNVPGKPFGVCAFSPHTCGCGAAGNCTTQD